MSEKTAKLLPVAILAAVLFACLCGEHVRTLTGLNNFPPGDRAGLSLVWSLFSLAVVFAAIQYAYFSKTRFLRLENSDLWLFSAGLIGFLNCLCRPMSLHSTQVIIFLTGLALAKGTSLWVLWNRWINPGWLGLFFVIGFLITILALSSMHSVPVATIFLYHGQLRWSGIWDSPNTFGVLLGGGIILALGTLALIRKGIQGDADCHPFWAKRRNASTWFVIVIGLLAFALGAMGNGLLRSYSRGAWLGVSVALLFLLFFSGKRHISLSQQVYHGLKKYGVLFVTAIIMTLLLLFWSYHFSENSEINRFCSVVNSHDFSVRNRIAAFEGALQISGEQPLFGAGWNMPDPLYENYYASPPISECAAIQVNDFLTIGTTLGIPVLFCFGLYLWLALAKTVKRKEKADISESEWLKSTCRAGVVVLLVGFWFDGGFFKLPTAATFWILLELGVDDAKEAI